MKILLLRGNPRKNGATEKFCDFFAKGVRANCENFTDIDLCSKNIQMCKGCYCCTSSGGECVLKDDMNSIAKLVDEADVLVLASPLYFCSMSAQMKCFLDRCFPFIDGYKLDLKNDTLINETRFSNPSKKLVTISVASGVAESFEGLSLTYTLLAQALNFEYLADIRRAESAYFLISNLSSLRLRSILNAFEKMGVQLAKSGSIDCNLIAQAQLKISDSHEAFAKRAAIFWELKKNRK